MGAWLPDWIQEPLEDVYRAITSPPGDPQIILSPDEKSDLADAIDQIVPALDRTLDEGVAALKEIADSINFMGGDEKEPSWWPLSIPLTIGVIGALVVISR